MDVITEHKDGVLLRIKVKTGAKRSGLMGIQGDTLKVAVKEQPQKGQANRAVIELITGYLNAYVRIKSGETSRVKTLFIEGVRTSYVKTTLGL